MLDRRIGEGGVQRGDDMDARVVGRDLGRVAGHHGRQLQARRGGDQRGVEGLADIAVSDQGDVQNARVGHGAAVNEKGRGLLPGPDRDRVNLED